jgi:hypothetical protein
MKNLVVMAFALILGIFVLGSGQRPAHAGAAAAAITATQSEAVKDGGMTKVWYRGGWRGGWGPGWGWGPVWAWGPGWGPACHWHCGPYRCWRACW